MFKSERTGEKRCFWKQIKCIKCEERPEIVDWNNQKLTKRSSISLENECKISIAQEK